MDRSIDDLQIQRALRAVAQAHGMTSRQVRRNIEQMLAESRDCADPSARAAWASVPRAAEVPTLEEVLRHLASRIPKDMP